MIESSMRSGVTIRDGGDGSALARIDQYELLSELGGGGFGTVYLAKDTVSGVQYAVKGLPPFVKNNREELENIKANFALVSRLSHTNIARAYVLHLAQEVSYNSAEVRQKLRVDPGDTLMVMEYAPGITLSQWRRQFPDRKVPLDKTLEIARQIASALDYAHGQKILHRDIKPANVMIETKPDGELVARVLDFGLAAEIRSSMGRVSREIHDTSGTRPYMAPEQWLGSIQSPATDQYALAVLIHELLTGDVPFSSAFDTGDPVVMMNVVGREPVKLPESLSPCIKAAFAKALAKKPEDRFESCAALVAALEGKAPRGGTKKEGGSSKVLGILVLLAALAGGAWWWTSGRNETKPAQVPPVSNAPLESPTPPVQTIPPAPTVPPVPTGPTESDIAEISVEATVQKARVERIDDADGFKAKKIALADVLTRATANSKAKRWAEAAQGFTNYVDGCKALVVLDTERKSAIDKRGKATDARLEAERVEAAKYATTCWTNAVRLLESGDNAFRVMNFLSASNEFTSATMKLTRCAEEAKAEHARQASVLKIRADAISRRDKVEGISDENGFKASKDELEKVFKHADTLFGEKKRWTEAMQSFSNYVTRADTVIKLNDERQNAFKERNRATDAKALAEKEKAEEYDRKDCDEAANLMGIANDEFSHGRFLKASETFAKASKLFGKSIDIARGERERIERERQLAIERRKAAQNAREDAEIAEASVYALIFWNGAVTIYEKANGEFERKEHAIAAKTFEEALQAFQDCAMAARRKKQEMDAKRPIPSSYEIRIRTYVMDGEEKRYVSATCECNSSKVRVGSEMNDGEEQIVIGSDSQPIVKCVLRYEDKKAKVFVQPSNTHGKIQEVELK